MLNPSEANTLDFFLAQQAKTGAWFLWTPPGVPQARFRCDNWTKQLTAPAVWEVQATFRQVFSFTLPRLGASPGYFVLSGGPVAWRWNRVLTISLLFDDNLKLLDTWTDIDGSSFSLTGNDVAMAKTRPMYPETGAFVVTTPNAAVLKGYVLSGETGSFAYTGNNVVFIYFSLSSAYFDDIASQIWGWDRDFQVDWWGD